MTKKKQIKLDPEIIKGIRKQINFLHDEKRNLRILGKLNDALEPFSDLNHNSINETIFRCIESIDEKIENLQVHVSINE